MFTLPTARYIRIILEIATFFAFHPVEPIFETSQFGFKNLNFSTRLSPEIQNSESIRSLAIAKDLIPSFLIKIYSLLSFILFLSFPFLFFYFRMIHFIFHAVPVIRMMYPILSGRL